MKHIPLFLLLIAAAMIFGCGQKSQIVNYTGNGPGNIKGKVVLFDTLWDDFARGAAVLPDSSGVLVSLEGTMYSAISDSHGQWEISNVPSGDYPSLMFSKSGFGQTKTYLSVGSGYLVMGNETTYTNADLYRINRLSCDLVLRPFENFTKTGYHDSLFARSDGSTYIGEVVDTTVIPNGAANFSSRILDAVPGNKIFRDNVIIYCSKTMNMDPLDPATFQYSSALTGVNTATGVADISILRTDLLNAGFHSGDTIYCVAYAGGLYSGYDSYTDRQTFVQIYSGLSPFHSDISSFVLP